jgi:outer membrane murein-binding lipoprotein Lpp
MFPGKLLAAFAVVSLVLSGCASTGTVDESSVGRLAADVGVTTEQAQAGIGTMLKLAQARLAVSEYDRISAVVPRGNEYTALADRLGAFQGATPTATGLAGAFAKLGFTPAQAERFVPEVTNYVSKAAGTDVGMQLGNAMR